MSTYPHKQLLQTLNALLIELRELQVVVEPDEFDHQPDMDAVRAGLVDMDVLANEALTLVRSSFEMATLPELSGLQLSEALSQLIETSAEQLGLASRITVTGGDEQQSVAHMLEPAAERILYLVAREALYQIERHRAAHRLRFSFHYRADDVQMTLEDDGLLPLRTDPDARGNEPQAALALNSEEIADDALLTPILSDLRLRLEQLGGTLEVQLLVGQGVRVSASVPYHYQQALTVASPSFASSEQISILLVDTLAVTRAGLQHLLEPYHDLVVIGEAMDGVQAVSETLELGPQVVLMDAHLPHDQSLEALRQIKQLNLNTRVLLLASEKHEVYLYATLRAGADGYVLKDIGADELARALRAVARGEMLIHPQLAGRLLSQVGRQGRSNGHYSTLTTRELEVLRLLTRGLRNKEIAARLYVSERTVNFHLANIYQKLNVSGRTEALSKAIEQGLVMP
ncbi:helix-turn-helix transcriptional regulator [Dictyobacter arantiisoli]|uniref:DNA-binding response regulator n=1 Tax=Dictyobacter arantiisoli TaxID=2014874 RepID=A0A5A5T5S9_9CHLR|nr:response regulator transcription factor family protein [Dictyobacter arantiisoli]GCF06698.1 hypothetical protein KDI_02620 [Dictyobacter arantiisoli]